MEFRRPLGNRRFTNSWRTSGNSSGYTSQSGRNVFTRIDLDTKFFDGKNVEGIHLLTDFDQVRELQIRLGRFTKGPKDFFPANWPVSLSAENIYMLSSRPYVVAPKPTGPRFLLYIDSSGEMFLENMTQHIFRVDEEHVIKMESFSGRSVTDSVLDGIFTREKSNSDDSCDEEQGTEEDPGKLTFVIRDAVRCNGIDLTDMGIVERIDFIKEEIIKPRLYALKNRKWSVENEAFSLDIVEYMDAYQTDSYLSNGFEKSYEYPMRSFVFTPREKGYICGTNSDVLQWTENERQQCSFRLKIPKGTKEPKEGELHVGGPCRMEMKWETIPLTDELRKLDGCIVDCAYVDHHWVFVKQRFDRRHPNGKRALQEKLQALSHPVSRDLLLTMLDGLKGFN